MKKHNVKCVSDLKRQQGLTFISWIFVIAILVFCGLFAFRVVPMYAENTYVVNALKQLADPSSRVSELSDKEIKRRLEDYYAINNVRSEGPQNIVVSRKSGEPVIIIDYENRENLFWNIDVVATFQNHLDTAHPELCCKPIAESRSAKF